MTSVVAAKTDKIRVGAGGIMLPNHSALSVMERFTVLESLFPERIDLAIGRAPGTDPITSIALARTMDVHNKNPFTEQLDDLLHFFNRDFPSNHPYAPIKTPGNTDKIPEMFMLGSSQGGVQFALHKEMGFAFAHHINPGMANAALNYYKDNFKKSHPEKDLYSIISIAIITAETDEEAKRLSAPLELMWTKRMSGNAEFELIDPETASTYVYTPQEQIVRE